MNGNGSSRKRKRGSQMDPAPNNSKWENALKLVRKEKEMKGTKISRTSSTYAETLGLPLVLLGLHPSDQGLMNSHEKQLFLDKIATFYKHEDELNNNSIVNGVRHAVNSAHRKKKVFLDDPNAPELFGAPKRKAHCTKLKFMDLASSRPFEDASLYNITAIKTNADGLKMYRIQWFQDPERQVNGCKRDES